MASIVLENITLSYPILGGDKPKVVGPSKLGGAGSVIKDGANRTRSVVALEGISFELQDGDRLGLIGRNGSGKSTLLRIIAGIYEPLEGHARIEGAVAGLFSVGLGVHPETTGYRNIMLSGLMAGYSRAQVTDMMPEIAAFCDLGEYLDMPVRTYSNGMAMRLKFACATAFDADIILMDEWLGAGDPSFQDKAQRRLRKMVDDAGILMLASHNHTVIRKSCNKLAWLDRGKLRAFGDVEEVLAYHDEATRPPASAPPAKTPRQVEKERDRAARIEADRERRRQEKRVELKREQRRQEKRKQIAEAKKAAAEGTHATDTTT